MKKCYFLFGFILFATTTALSQPVFTYGSDKVQKDEFLRAYNKNKTPVEDKEKALREYLDLYVRFKLKVKAATLLRLDTLETLKADVSNFRNQVQESYMNDERGVNDLVNEAFERSQKDIHIIHFFVGMDEKAPVSDTAREMRAINEVYESLKKGKTNYRDIAAEVSGKLSPVRETDLGFVTAFTLPYQYENIVFGLKAGEASKPYRSKSGWHVFKVTEERKSVGKWRVAQVLLAFPPEGSGYKLSDYTARADSFYRILTKGANFGEIAKEFSQDKLTYLNGGELPEFGTGRFDLSFESEVFKLKKDGEISKPIQTPFGYHIVKRLGHTPTPSDRSDAGYMYELKQKVLQDERVSAAREKFVRDVIVKTGYKRNALVKDAELFRFADSVKPGLSAAEIKKFPVSGKVIFSFAKSSVKGADFLNFVHDYKSSELYRNENNTDLLQKYKEATALEYYKKHLEEFNPEFRYQMQEFKEGNMLFEIMERNVWSKAANDSAGLAKLYNTRKAGYVWPESGDVLVFNCSNSKAAADGIALLKKGWTWKQIADSSSGTIQADSARYELNQIPLTDGVKPTAGLIGEPVVNNTDGTAIFVKVLRLYPAGQQRSFDEARGLVINDYQVQLEEEWVENLKKKYPVKVDEALFKTLIK